MTTSPLLPVEVITSAAQLNAAVKGMEVSPAIAFDTESNSMHYYPEQLCLIQIATRTEAKIVDTICLQDISPLSPVLADKNVMKIIHGADYDVRCLDRHCGFRMHNIYDTYIAARFAGEIEVGLGALIKNLLGIAITKSKRLQTADWGRRPLSDEAIDYAASDVFYLLQLQQVLDKKLRELGRIGWVKEELLRLEDIRYQAPDMENAFFSMKGAEVLDGRGLAILKYVFAFREQEARRQHRPPFFIVPDAVLIELALNPAAVNSGMGVNAQRYGTGLRLAVQAGLAASPVQPPLRIYTERMSPAELKLFARLKEWRTSIAAKLALDPSLLWPMVSLQRLARAPESFDVEINAANVREWQRAEFAAELKKVLATKG